MLYKPIKSKLIIGDSAVSIRYGGGVYKSEHTYQVYLLVYTRSAMVNQNISELDQGKSATIGRIYILYRTGRDADWSTRGRTFLVGGGVISEICRYLLAHSICFDIRGRKSI